MIPVPASEYMASVGLNAGGSAWLGGNWWGRTTDLLFEQPEDGYGDEVLATWGIETFGSVESRDLALFVWQNGELFARVPATDGLWYYSPPRDYDVDLDVLLFPNRDEWEDWPYVGRNRAKGKVALAWSFGGECDQIKIFAEAGTSITSYTKPIKRYTRPVATIAAPTAASGGTLEVGGKWVGRENSASITVTVTEEGALDVGEYLWQWGSTLGVGTITYGYIDLVNGLRIKFESDHTYAVGDTWTIALGFPTEHTTRQLDDGAWAFQVATYNRIGEEQLSNTLAKTIDTPPASPTHVSTVYNGSGSATITWLIPDESDINRVRLYKDLSPIPILDTTTDVTYGANYAAAVTGIEEGVSRFCLRCVDTSMKEEENEDWVQIVVDSADNDVTYPNPPVDISAEEIAGDKVRFTVHCDETSDEIELYRDAEDGVVDYTTAIGTITNPQASASQTLTEDVAWTAGAGSFLVAARAKSGTYLETNTDIVGYLFVELMAPPLATLTGEVTW